MRAVEAAFLLRAVAGKRKDYGGSGGTTYMDKGKGTTAWGYWEAAFAPVHVCLWKTHAHTYGLLNLYF